MQTQNLKKELTVDKICFFCQHTFESSKSGYELCDECGGATISIELKQKLEHSKEAGRLHNLFACSNGYHCHLAGVYEPSCEVPKLRVECLTPLHDKLDTFEAKVDKLLRLLSQNEQSAQ